MLACSASWDGMMSYRDRVSLGRPTMREFYAGMTGGERVLLWIALVNFVVFVAIAVPLGGSALNGMARDGHYYLMQGGVYTEVSGPVFIYSTIHSLSLIVTHPLGIAAGLRAQFRMRKLARRS
jgi:hypothetical protein